MEQDEWDPIFIISMIFSQKLGGYRIMKHTVPRVYYSVAAAFVCNGQEALTHVVKSVID